MTSNYPPGPPPPPPPPPTPGMPVGGQRGPQHAQTSQPIMYQQQQQQQPHQQPLNLHHPTTFPATYYGLELSKVSDRATLGGRTPSWSFATKRELQFTQEDYRDHIRRYRAQRARKSVWDDYADMRSDNMRKQVDTLLTTKRQLETNPYAEWSLACIETQQRPAPGHRNATETYRLTVILKRCPKYVEGMVDEFGRGGLAETVVDINRPFVGRPAVQQQQQHQQQQPVYAAGIAGLNPQAGFVQQQAGQVARALGPPPPPPPPPPPQLMPQPVQLVQKPKVIQQGFPKLTQANGQPLQPVMMDDDSDDEIVNIHVSGKKGKMYSKQYPRLPPPPIGKHAITRKLSMKGLQDARRVSGGPEVLVVRDPKLERDVKNIKKALDRRHMTDSDEDSSALSDHSFSSGSYLGTPPSSTDSNMQSRMHRRARRRLSGEPWTERRLTAERIHQKPPVRRHRSRSPSPRHRMSLSRRNTESKIVEVPMPMGYRPEAADYLGRPLAERRQSYQVPLDFPPRPRVGQRALTYDGGDQLRSLIPHRPLLNDADERDVLARDINRLKEQEARDYIVSQDMRGERMRKELELRAIERRELDRRMSRGIVDEEMERFQARDRLERLQRLNEQDRLSDARRLDEKLRNLRIDDLERRDRRNSYSGYGI